MTTAAELVAPWEGPFGGVPPVDRATPELIEAAVELGIAARRAEIAAVAANPAPPDFANTIEALEESGRALRRADRLREIFALTSALGPMPAIQQRLTAGLAALEDEIWQNAALFARVKDVHAARERLAPDQARLVELILDRMIRRGAGLSEASRARLQDINARIATSEARFHQALLECATGEPVWVTERAKLDGVPEPVVAAAAQLAAARGRPGAWAIAAVRPTVWAVLQFGRDRDLRCRVRAMWMDRGGATNRALAAEIVSLRGEKARLLGYRSYAHLATSNRIAGTPERALAQLDVAWTAVRAATEARRAELQALADADGLNSPIAAWDWVYYSDRLRRARCGLDAQAERDYLSLENVLAALLDAMGRLHGLACTWRGDVPVVHPDVRVLELRRGGETLGVIWLDLIQREGKVGGSRQIELRTAESFRGRVVPLSMVCANFVRESDGRVPLGFEEANVLFHEFGHALHMIMSRARYPSLGPLAVEWDFVELPSQLNERWLLDRDLLKCHARHHATGAPIPDALIDGLVAAQRFDRVISVDLAYLAPAIVDMRMYLAANGDPVDPVAIEAQVYDELGMPAEVDPIFRVWNQVHSFIEDYAAGLYVYLWADVMAADAIEAFETAPDGLYDREMADRWVEKILSAGASHPGAEAFRAFCGRDPDPAALLRRFALL
jgi:peptidyl-dipeptidase Dcp